ncbi:hypothetical protein D2T29_12470 [Sinirhodobacter populi]|uniref:Growth inhibitor PemK n=1 Tax=Paenirhodobacter populi TaxID=2306993 RepID=A0A443KCC7_9RHOB|nr:hypothetical protein [Sinirhodobacter populi]RWR30479.1 hypothetical protein D2T29_12470 [Sinirhodobacter populi]
MDSNFPQAGQVIGYHYLWRRQAVAGEISGRKSRPTCVALIVANKAGQHILFLAPITKQMPGAERIAIEVPETEARRANLDRDIRLWVIVDEVNADLLEDSYTLEDREPRGRFSAAFTDRIIQAIHEVRHSGKLSITSRT